MGWVWIVTKVLRTQRKGENVLLHPGDPIPEAATWDNAEEWQRRGYIRKIRRPTPENPVDVEVSHLFKAGKIKLRLTEIEDIPEEPPLKKRGRGRPRKVESE